MRSGAHRMTRLDVTGDDVVRKVGERVVALRKVLEDIEAEIARSSAAHREQAERLGRSIAAIHAEISQRARQVIASRPETSRRDDNSPPAANPRARSSARAP